MAQAYNQQGQQNRQQQYELQDQKPFTEIHQEDKQKHLKSKEFLNTLFSITKNWTSCLLAFFCPICWICCIYPKKVEEVGGRGCFHACCFETFGNAYCCFFCMDSNRRHVTKKFGIDEESRCMECLLTVCCHCCATIQVSNEIDERKDLGFKKIDEFGDQQ